MHHRMYTLIKTPGIIRFVIHDATYILICSIKMQTEVQDPLGTKSNGQENSCWLAPWTSLDHALQLIYFSLSHVNGLFR